MKIQYVFLIAMILLNCGSKSDNPVEYGSAPLEDVLTLELTFGDKDLPDEYLLARPSNVAVDTDNNIYVFDEDRIKVFTSEGKPKAIIGSPGQGPGEFDNMINLITVSKEGFIAAGSPGFGGKINVYNEKFDFIGNYHKNKFHASLYSSNGNEQKIYVFGEDCYVGISAHWIFEDDYCISCEKIVYYTPGDSVVLALYDKPVGVELLQETATIIGGGNIVIDAWGDLIVFSHSRLETSIHENEYLYKLHIYDRKSGERKTIESRFNPVFFEFQDHEDYLSTLSEESRRFYNKDFWREVYYKEQALQKKYQFLEPLIRINLDGKYLFASIKTEQDEAPIIDVFDLESLKKISSFNQKNNVFFHFIRNGYAYGIKRGQDIFPVIEKYRIDPAVYGK